MLENLIIAHRGIFNNQNIPENSILAFKTALKRKIPIELDLQLTKDNVLVVFHDDNLCRMTGNDNSIENLDYNEVKKLYLLKTKQKIPTFKEVLSLINGEVLLDVEIKNTKRKKEICQKVIEELENYKGEVLLKSFNPIIIKKIKRKTRKYRLGLLLTDHYDNKIFNFFFKTKLPIKYVKPNFLAINKRMINEKFYNKMNKKYYIFLWTITSKQQMLKFQSEYNNLNYICNNLLDD